MPEQSVSLSIEQKFELRKIEVQVKELSREESQQRLVNLYEQMLLAENRYQQQLRAEWGIESVKGERHD